jgi:hypothetical protein
LLVRMRLPQSYAAAGLRHSRGPLQFRSGLSVLVSIDRPSLTGLNEVPKQCECAQLPCICMFGGRRHKMRSFLGELISLITPPHL